MWTATKGAKKDVFVSRERLTAILEEIRREIMGNDIIHRDQSDFGRKAWMHSDKSSNTWVAKGPKEHNGRNARKFVVVVQTYFGVGLQCLTRLVGQYIRQNASKGRKDRET